LSSRTFSNELVTELPPPYKGVSELPQKLASQTGVLTDTCAFAIRRALKQRHEQTQCACECYYCICHPTINVLRVSIAKNDQKTENET